MLSRYRMEPQGLVPFEDDLASVWIFVKPDRSEQQYLTDTLKIDKSDIESALDPDEVPRLSIETSYTTLIWNHPRCVSANEQSMFQVSTSAFFLSNERLVIIFPEEYNLSDSRFIQKTKVLLDLILNYLHATIKHYIGHLKVIRMIATGLEDKISKSMENRHLLQMFTLSEDLVYYLNAIESNATVLTKLYSFCERNDAFRNRMPLVEDLITENQQSARQAEIYSQVMSGLMDARGTLVNNNMSLLMKNLTLINVIFLPLNLIASILGMSEFSMMTRKLPWYISYPIFILAMIAVGWITIRIISKIGVEFHSRPRRKKEQQLKKA